MLKSLKSWAKRQAKELMTPPGDTFEPMESLNLTVRESEKVMDAIHVYRKQHSLRDWLSGKIPAFEISGEEAAAILESGFTFAEAADRNDIINAITDFDLTGDTRLLKLLMEGMTVYGVKVLLQE